MASYKKLITVQRTSKWPLKDIVGGILFVVKTGIQWRLLPPDFPPWQTVYWYFCKWKSNGVLDLIHVTFLGLAREHLGQQTSPSVGIIDSQSARMTSIGSADKGIDGNKKIKGRKRQIMVDTNGFIMEVVVHAANTHDSIGGKELLNRIFEERRYDYSRLKKIYADQGYKGAIIELAKEYKWDFEVVQRDANGGFKVLPKRWIVERTFAWFDNFRRLARDYERLASTSEAMIKWAAIIMIHKRI